MVPKFKYKGDYPEILDKSTILIVEDDRVVSMMIKGLFENYGFKNIVEACNGEEGLARTKELEPDLVILDMNMPVMNGFEYCKAVRRDPELKNTTILVQTGLTDSKDQSKVFEAGATDYVTKPINPHEIYARSIVHLERALDVKELRSYRNRVEKELEAAKQLQNVTMPSDVMIRNISKKYSISIDSYFQPSSEMGGDFWGFDELENNKLAIYNVDFSGHGVHAALNAFRLHTLINSQKHQSILDPGKYMTWLNCQLATLIPAEQYATMFYGIIDFDKEELQYSCAACPNPVIFYNDGKEPHKLLDGRGFPLGAVLESSYETETVPFKSKDMIMLFSDALIETADKNGKFLDINALTKMVYKYFFKSDDNETSFNKLLKDFNNKYFGIEDDLTISIYYKN